MKHVLIVMFVAATLTFGGLLGVHALESCDTGPMYKGFVDRAQCSVIQGWAADAKKPNQSITVNIYADDSLVGSMLANGERKDVADFLGDNGMHGFIIPTPYSLKDGKEHVIKVVFDSSDVELQHSGMALKCDSLTTSLHDESENSIRGDLIVSSSGTPVWSENPFVYAAPRAPGKWYFVNPRRSGENQFKYDIVFHDDLTQW